MPPGATLMCLGEKSADQLILTKCRVRPILHRCRPAVSLNGPVNVPHESGARGLRPEDLSNEAGSESRDCNTASLTAVVARVSPGNSPAVSTPAQSGSGVANSSCLAWHAQVLLPRGQTPGTSSAPRDRACLVLVTR